MTQHNHPRVDVYYSILTENMGEAWLNPVRAAEQFRQFLAQSVTETITALYPEVSVDTSGIVIQYASGYSGELDIWSEPFDALMERQIRDRLITCTLDQAWNAWMEIERERMEQRKGGRMKLNEQIARHLRARLDRGFTYKEIAIAMSQRLGIRISSYRIICWCNALGYKRSDKFARHFTQKYGRQSLRQFHQMVQDGRSFAAIGRHFGFTGEYAAKIHERLYGTRTRRGDVPV